METDLNNTGNEWLTLPQGVHEDFIEARRNAIKADSLANGMGNKMSYMLENSLTDRLMGKWLKVSFEGLNLGKDGAPYPLPARIIEIAVKWLNYMHGFCIKITLYAQPFADPSLKLTGKEKKILAGMSEEFEQLKNEKDPAYLYAMDYAEGLGYEKNHIKVMKELRWLVDPRNLGELLKNKKYLGFSDDAFEYHYVSDGYSTWSDMQQTQ